MRKPLPPRVHALEGGFCFSSGTVRVGTRFWLSLQVRAAPASAAEVVKKMIKKGIVAKTAAKKAKATKAKKAAPKAKKAKKAPKKKKATKKKKKKKVPLLLNNYCNSRVKQ